jgi:hypothetical protein
LLSENFCTAAIYNRLLVFSGCPLGMAGHGDTSVSMLMRMN